MKKLRLHGWQVSGSDSHHIHFVILVGLSKPVFKDLGLIISTCIWCSCHSAHKFHGAMFPTEGYIGGSSTNGILR